MRGDARKLKVVWFAVIVLGVGVLMYGCGGGEEAEMPAATPEAAPELVPVEGPVSKAEDTPAAEGGMLIVPRVGIGEVKFGMTLDEVKQLWGEPDEGGDGWCSYFSRGVALETLRPSTVVYKATCHSKQWGMPDAEKFADFEGKTAEGIGIGSTEAEVVSAYGDPTKRESEEGVTLLRYENMQTLFMLGDGGVLSVWLVDDTQLGRK